MFEGLSFREMASAAVPETCWIVTVGGRYGRVRGGILATVPVHTSPEASQSSPAALLLAQKRRW